MGESRPFNEAYEHEEEEVSAVHLQKKAKLNTEEGISEKDGTESLIEAAMEVKDLPFKFSTTKHKKVPGNSKGACAKRPKRVRYRQFQRLHPRKPVSGKHAF